MSNTLSNRALLAILNISQWTGRRYDKRATDTVETTHKSDKNVGNYTKKLLPSAKELEAIQSQAGALRNWFYEQTLPWYADGSRILSSKNYMDFTNAFRTKKADFEQAVNDFLAVYPTLKAQAQAKLGDLYQEREYPSEAYLRTAFSCEISFMPVPDVKDFRVEILEEEREAFEKRMKETEGKAMRECWERLHSAVSHAATKLQQPDGQIRDSMVSAIQKVCAVLPKLNFSDDPHLETMRQEVERIAASIVPSDCRGSLYARQEAAKELNDVMAKMSAFMGS